MDVLGGTELKKFIRGENVERYLKSDAPSHKRTQIQMEGSIEGVAETLFCLNVSDQIDAETVKVKVNKESDEATATCTGYAPAECPE